MIQLAGSIVQLNDNIYVHRAAAFGQVIKLLNSNAIVRVSKDGAYRDFTMQTGGIIGGELGASWFPPIELGLLRGDSAKYAAVTAVVATLLENI